MAGITYLNNYLKTYDVSGMIIAITTPEKTWSYTFSASSDKTLVAATVAINNAYIADGGTDIPYLNIDDYEYPTWLHGPSGLPFDDDDFEYEVTGNALGILLGYMNNTVDTYVTSFGWVNPYWGCTRLPAVTDLTALTGYNTGGGFEVSEPIELVRVGEDFVSYVGVESSEYQVVSGFEFPYRYHESQIKALTLFMNEARGYDLLFSNDTWSIGRGYTFNIGTHSGAKASIVYAFIDVVKRGIYLLKKGDFSG